MEENVEKNQNIETPVYEVSNESKNFGEIDDLISEDEKRPEDVVFKHPQQILTNKQIQLLLKKQAWLEKEKKARVERGEDEGSAEELTPTEKGAIDLLLLRMRLHKSKPKQLTAKQRTAKKAKRKETKKSRKANRV